MNLHLFSLCSFVSLRLSNLSLAAIVQITGALNKKSNEADGNPDGTRDSHNDCFCQSLWKSVDQFLMRWLQYPL